ncbi:H-type small acid-soluble spore protein [Aquibacillus albus]|uniref:Small, acid-soluble spore protein H n=1 Tax=Aquibacillus albus TaxID=1168171 RepID=A0ABS2N3G3_9BACI|nr:H-type small acid-soluble spore protein [Aquibacillus albus]MBM7572603.1 small acid-soluble spore protein H (minor) [Aquibacillus albus]
MDVQRAQEIIESPKMINVLYEETPIYIQHVDEDASTARVFPVDEPQNERNVPLDSLREA